MRHEAGETGLAGFVAQREGGRIAGLAGDAGAALGIHPALVLAGAGELLGQQGDHGVAHLDGEVVPGEQGAAQLRILAVALPCAGRRRCRWMRAGSWPAP